METNKKKQRMTWVYDDDLLFVRMMKEKLPNGKLEKDPDVWNKIIRKVRETESSLNKQKEKKLKMDSDWRFK